MPGHVRDGAQPAAGARAADAAEADDALLRGGAEAAAGQPEREAFLSKAPRKAARGAGLAAERNLMGDEDLELEELELADVAPRAASRVAGAWARESEANYAALSTQRRAALEAAEAARQRVTGAARGGGGGGGEDDGDGDSDEESGEGPRRMSRRSDSVLPPQAGRVTPLPKKRLLVLVGVQLNESFAINVLWPFLAFFVQDTGMAQKDEDVGYYAGLLVASFFFTQFLSSTPWGIISDRFGRRKSLLLGVCGTILSMIVFGFSNHYWLGVVSRMICGALNGNVGVAKSYLGEITDSTNQALGFSALSFSWGFGAIVAPVIGGFLSRPADRYPGTFSRDGLFGRFPYLLPCMFSVAIGLFSVTLGFFFLKESERWLEMRRQRLRAQRPRLQKRTSAGRYEALALSIDATSASASSLTATEAAATPRETAERVGLTSGGGGGGGGDGDAARKAEAEAQGDEEDETDSASAHAQQQQPAPPPPPKASELLRDRYALLGCASYWLTATHFILNDELLPLFAKTRVEDGGLSFGPAEVGFLLTIQGVTLIFFQMFLFPRITRALGTVRTYQLSTLAALFYFAFFPSTSFTALLGRAALWAELAPIMVVRAMIGSSAFTAVMIIVNNGSPTGSLGAVNGLGQAGASLSRALGPLLGGSIWSLSLSSHLPAHQFLPFLLPVSICVAAVLLARRLTDEFNYPATERLRARALLAGEPAAPQRAPAAAPLHIAGE